MLKQKKIDIYEFIYILLPADFIALLLLLCFFISVLYLSLIAIGVFGCISSPSGLKNQRVRRKKKNLFSRMQVKVLLWHLFSF